jgi:Tfp pilus assembly protein PilN
MIEVNLLKGKKEFRLPILLGVDLSLINFKFLIIAILLDYCRPFYEDKWRESLVVIQEQVKKSNEEMLRVRKSGQGLEHIQEEIGKANEKEQELNEILVVVKKITESKKNPMSILLNVSKNIPDDLWLNNLVIENDVLLLSGECESYRNIGLFIEKLKGLIFFENNIRLEDSKTLTNEKTGKRTEAFTIKAVIVRYD